MVYNTRLSNRRSHRVHQPKMNNNYRPTPSMRKSQRSRSLNEKATLVHPDTLIDEDWLDQYQGRISFWSYSFTKVRPDTKSSKFRVYTRQFIPLHRLKQLIQEKIPESQAYPLWGYSYRHTFDVRTLQPMPWAVFIWETVTALGDHL